MIITNKYNLPDVLMRFARGKNYSKGDAKLSVTELIDSPRVVALKHKHFDEMEQDVSDTVFSLFGTAVHHILEKYSESDVIKEQRYFKEINGWKISGAIDRQVITPHGRIIEDWKVTSSYTVMAGKIDWEYQLNLYAYLVRAHGHEVSGLKINAIVRDWARRNVGKTDYPETPIVQIDVPLWSFEDQDNFIKQRIALHAATVMDDPPLCTPDERWAKPETWALQKVGAKRATKVFYLKEEADAANKPGFEVIHRPGVNTRCVSFCDVKQYCDFGRQLGDTNAEDSSSPS